MPGPEPRPKLASDQETSDGVTPNAPLRRGWTTGACATAAARAAFEALVTGEFPDPVEIALPRGKRVAFALARTASGLGWAMAGVIKDAGDDPDVTHGVLVLATVARIAPGSGVTFAAGPGVGTVTKPGLLIPPGEPAINPVPRAMMRAAIEEAARSLGASGDVRIEIAIPGGEAIAQRTMNARLGILGGLSILGTTGIVVPYSCAAFIHSIYRGIDVARAVGLRHIAGSTGATSEAAVRRLYGLEDTALIEMGDFAGGMLKYLRKHPVPRLTIAGGFAKMTKLAQGLLDLHSRAGEVDREWLAARLEELGARPDVADAARRANSALQILELARVRELALGDLVAAAAGTSAARVLEGSGISLDVAVFDREGRLVGRSGPLHGVAPR